MDLDEIWAKSLSSIQKNIPSPVGYNIYIKDAVPVSFDGRTLKLAVGLSISKTMIESRYKTHIESAFSRAAGANTSLEVIVSQNPQALRQKNGISSSDENKIVREDSVNPKYTFDNFVIGSSNELATTAAMTTAENPGDKYNPLFIYGNSGLGKTHLMHAIGNKILEKSPYAKIVYVSSEKFTNEFITCIREGRMEEFRQIYRRADVLLVDDVQFLTQKEQTQEEFFHTFNELYNTNRQIVMTSDRKPKELVNLEDRLVTRFEQGLIVDIAVPNYETRVAILQKKAQLQHSIISEEVIEYIATRIKSNIRELEGALTKVVSHVEIHNIPMNVESAKEALDKILADGHSFRVTPAKIVEKVCTYYNIAREDLLGKAKTKNFALPRQIAMYLCKTMTSMNFVEIARDIGNKDRTTVMHNVEKIASELETNEQLRTEIAIIKKDIESI